MNSPLRPRFGFFGKFRIGPKPLTKAFDGMELPWNAPSLKVWKGDDALICVGVNPRLNELRIWDKSTGVAVLDGRIDEIAREPQNDDLFEDKGPLSTELDSLIHASSWLSEDCLNRLIGDFALIDWDSERRVLLLARDPFGVRSLYYQMCANVVTISSDLELLVTRTGGAFELDWEQARALLVAPTVPVSLPNRTLLRDIARVIPGTVVKIDLGGIEVKRFWHPASVSRARNITLEQSVSLMTDSVARAIADRIPPKEVSIACHFSGGLDCSTISGMLAVNELEAAKRCEFLSWTPAVKSNVGPTELDIVGKLGEAWGIRILHLSFEDLEREMRKWNAARFDPSCNETMAPFERVGLNSVSLQCGVVMSGWGGDEFASSHGWGLPMELLWRGRWRELAAFLIRTDPAHGVTAIVNSILRFIRWLLPASAKFVLSKVATRVDDVIGNPFEYRTLDVNYHSSVRAAQISAYWSGHLVDRIEAWAALGRSYGVQYVYPLLDRRVVELALSLPGWHFKSGRESRIVFRRMASRFWPVGLAQAARKQEPALASVLKGFLSSSDISKHERELVRFLVENPKVLTLMPVRVQRVVRSNDDHKAVEAIRPFVEGLGQIRDSLSWIRVANDSQTG